MSGDVFQDAVDSLSATIDREMVIRESVIAILANFDEVLARPLPIGETEEERTRFEEKLREAHRLAMMYARTRCEYVMRQPLDEVTERIRAALA